MIFIYNKKGKIVECQLSRSEQHYLMKQNIKLLKNSEVKKIK